MIYKIKTKLIHWLGGFTIEDYINQKISNNYKRTVIFDLITKIKSFYGDPNWGNRVWNLLILEYESTFSKSRKM